MVFWPSGLRIYDAVFAFDLAGKDVIVDIADSLDGFSTEYDGRL